MKIVYLLLSMLCFECLIAQRPTPLDFDFWIGRWDVYKYGTDTLVGLSKIERAFNGTAIKEHYQSTRFAYYGESFSAYNRITGKWEQHWVDNSGTVLNIQGAKEENQMILTSCPDTTCNRVVWTDIPDGTVRQEWFQQRKGTENWNKVYDGHYKPADRNDDVKIAVQGLERLGNIRDFFLVSIMTSRRVCLLTD